MSSQESQEHRIKIDSLLRQLEQVVADKSAQPDSVFLANQRQLRGTNQGKEPHGGRRPDTEEPQSNAPSVDDDDQQPGTEPREQSDDNDDRIDDDADEDEDGQDDDDDDAGHQGQGAGGDSSAAQREHGQVLLKRASLRLVVKRVF